MNEARLVARMMGMTITTAQARRTFPGVPVSAFFAFAPPSDRGRVLTLRQAFDAARSHAELEAAAARAKACAAADEERRAAVAVAAFKHVAGVIDREVEALLASLHARSARPRTIATVARIARVNARQIGFARARTAALGGDDARPS